MSVTLHTKKLLGSDIGPEGIIEAVNDAVWTAADDAEKMCVTPKWDSIVLKVGDEAEYEGFSFAQAFSTIRPYLTLVVQAVRK